MVSSNGDNTQTNEENVLVTMSALIIVIQCMMTLTITVISYIFHNIRSN